MAILSTIEINTAPAKQSINDIEQELQETNQALKQVDVNSKAFTDLQTKAAKLKGKLDEVNRTTDAISKGFQGFGENMAKVTAGVSGGITAITAGMQILGVENENVVAGIAKLQQLMAFTQGISAMKDLGAGFKAVTAAVKATTGAMSGVKAALIGTGIGAFLVLLGEMIAHWEDITAAIDDFIGSAGDASRVTAGLDASFTAIKTTIVAVGNAIVEFITLPFKNVINAINAFTETDGSLLDKLKAAGKAVKDTTVNAASSTVGEFKKIGTETANAYNNSIDRQNKEAEDKREAERQKAREQAIEAARKQAEKEAQAAQEAYNRAMSKNDYEQAYLEYMLGKVDEGDYQSQINWIGQLIAKQQEKLQLMKENGEQETTAYVSAMKVLDEYQAKLDETVDKQQALLNPTEEGTTGLSQDDKDALQQQLDNMKLWGEARYYALEQQYANEQALLDTALENQLISEEEYRKKSEQIQKLKAKSWLDVGVQVVNGMADMLSSIADLEEGETRESFERSKKLQMSIATIQMLTGIVTALSGAMTDKMTTKDWILAITQATTIAAAGATNIAKIARQKYDGGGSESVSATALSSTIVPPTQYTTAVQNANIESAVADSRVYVLESDIAGVGQRVSVQETENMY